MELVVYAQLLEEAPTILLRNLCFEKLDVNAIYTHLKEEKTPNVELKTLPSNLRFHQKVLKHLNQTWKMSCIMCNKPWKDWSKNYVPSKGYNCRGYSCGRSSQTLGTISRPLSYNNLKLPLYGVLLVLMIMKHGSKKWNHCSILMIDKIQPQFFNILTTTCRIKPNHGMKVKEEGMEKELSLSYEDTSMSLSLNPFLLCHELSSKELKLFLELYNSYMSLSKIHIFFGSYVESGYVERVRWFSCSLCGVFHAKLKGEFVENCDYVSSFLFASMKNFDGFILSIQILRLVL
ncbi:hypothetical protein M9H77_17519 [Catharanthus roseus]|uniref:Uncharacterized protein n=1 Tax=Catharanthus roseus TaxID=4058 RepID=A0ACC0B4T5_CATRO|nr:hypothetical protein M9H77_17519 [Catharanthus roseus]